MAAKKKQSGAMNAQTAGAIRGGLIGTVPVVGGAYGGYKGAKRLSGGSRGAGIAGGLIGTVTPGVGTAGGAYNGYHKSIDKNPRSKAKIGTHQPTKFKGRVKSK